MFSQDDSLSPEGVIRGEYDQTFFALELTLGGIRCKAAYHPFRAPDTWQSHGLAFYRKNGQNAA